MAQGAGAGGDLWDLRAYRQRLPEPHRRIRLDWDPPTLSAGDVRRARELLVGGLRSAPRSRPRTTAAVLVVLGEVGGELCVLLTRRADGLRSHAGELAFPGGRVMDGESLVAAALREAEEEVGLAPSAVRVLGSLGVGLTRRSSGAFEVVVAAVDAEPNLRLNAGEVADARWVPLGQLGKRAASELWFDPTAGWFRVFLFDLGEDLLWGASARVVARLLQLLGAT